MSKLRGHVIPVFIAGVAAALALAVLYGEILPAAAQTGGSGTPSLPGSRVGVTHFGSGNFIVSSSANEHGSFLWIVDSVQQDVTLCEKSTSGTDFACRKKRLQ